MEKSLKDLISRLPIPGLKESADRHAIADTLTDILSLPLKSSQIQFKDSIVTVSVPPVVKSAIRIKESVITDALRKQGINADSVR